MCGITGWVAYRRDLSGEGPVLDAMTATMACRGPDAAGTWARPHVAFGHRRLAVLDVEGGVQPMTADTAAGTVALTYSGEVYNYAELRRELCGRGHDFRTLSDTEVVLRAYLEWGEDVAERLNGMYAFAIWDGRTDALLLVRDRMGVKPLYHYETDDGVLFGSEPKSIFANPLARPVIRIDGLRELFVFARTPGHAIWDGMEEVRPGEVVRLDRSGLRRRAYWQLGAAAHPDDGPTTVRTIRELLEDTVRRQLVADVPQCVLLSGGLDSSAVTALGGPVIAAEGRRLRTFAVDFVGQDQSFTAEVGRSTQDAPFVHDVAEWVGTEHRDIVLDHATLTDPEVRRACVAARDAPTGLGDLDLSAYLLFRAVRERSTVAVSGEAGDEVFAGYPSFHLPQVRDAPTFPWLAVVPVALSGLLDRELLSALDLDGHLARSHANAVAEAPVLDGESDVDRKMRIICYLHLTRELPILLERKDRLSMAVGLEARVPYCDHRLVQYVYDVPWGMKAFDGREKSLLRAATRDALPPSVVGREKSGFPSPWDQRYVAAVQRQVREVLASNHPALELYDRRQVLDATRAGAASITRPQRSGMEKLLDVAAWLDLRRPSLQL